MFLYHPISKADLNQNAPTPHVWQLGDVLNSNLRLVTLEPQMASAGCAKRKQFYNELIMLFDACVTKPGDAYLPNP